MDEQTKILTDKIEKLEKDKKRLLTFVYLICDFLFDDPSGHCQYLYEQARNAVNDTLPDSMLWWKSLSDEDRESLAEKYSMRPSNRKDLFNLNPSLVNNLYSMEKYWNI